MKWSIKTQVATQTVSVQNITNHVISISFVLLQDSEFSQAMLCRGIALHLINDVIYGQLVNMRNVPTGLAHPELERIFENFDLWERRYILPIVRESETDSPDAVPKKLPSETVFPGLLPSFYPSQ